MAVPVKKASSAVNTTNGVIFMIVSLNFNFSQS